MKYSTLGKTGLSVSSLSLGASALGSVFHEIDENEGIRAVHAALDAVAPSLAVPAWFNEGVAEWFEARAAGKRRLSEHEQSILSQASSLGLLFAFSDLTSGGLGHLQPESAQLAYLQSYAFMEYLARSHGERRLRDVVSEYVRSGDLHRAFRRTYRADLEQLEQRHLRELGWLG